MHDVTNQGWHYQVITSWLYSLPGYPTAWSLDLSCNCMTNVCPEVCHFLSLCGICKTKIQYSISKIKYTLY